LKFSKLRRNPLIRIFKFVRPQRRAFISVCLLGLVLAVLDLIPPRLIGRTVDLLNEKTGETAEIERTLLIWAGVALAAQVLSGFQQWLANSSGERVIASIRERTFSHMQRLSVRFFGDTQVGRLFMIFGSDLESIRNILIWGANSIVTNSILALVSAYMIFQLDPILLLATGILVPLMGFVNAAYGRSLERVWEKIRSENARLGTNQSENIMGVRVVSAFNRQDANLAHFNQLQDETIALNEREARKHALYQPLLQTLRFAGRAVILILGGYRVVEGDIKTGALVSALLYWESLMTPAMNLTAIFNEAAIVKSGAARILGLLDAPIEVEDVPNAVELPPIVGDIEFENLSFGYRPEKMVLNQVNFSVERGTTVALVGGTGSGKSTLVSLLARFYRPTSGRILIDGYDLSQVKLTSLSKQIAMVTQSNFLFSGTVLENLRYDNPSISIDEIHLATRALGCHDRIEGMKNGYHTEVGEGGGALSLGERQLVCFARALLRNPRILLLDEATSSLDAEMDEQVRSALRKLRHNRTTFIVTHGLQTAFRADVILVLSRGRVAEMGHHDTLVQIPNGLYAKLWADSLGTADEHLPDQGADSFHPPLAET
jgi:ABC-type multidrug transport system fused ATPase/permease subunit